MESPEPTQKPILGAVVFFAVLVGVLILGTVLIDFNEVNTRGLLFITALLCCIFIAKNFYDNTAAAAVSKTVEKNTAAQLLFASRELYTELFHNSPVPYLIIDLEGIIKSANLAAHRLLGLAQGKVEGVNVFEQIRSEDSPTHLELLIRKYQNRIPVSDETVRVKHSKGTEAWALLSLFHFVNGKEHMGLLTLVDISKQKQIENAKAEFVSLASHQLRTPLAGIKWSTELLQIDAANQLTDRQKKYIDRLLSATERMSVLIDDFLRVSRFELGTFKPDYTVVQLKDLIEEVMNDQSERINQKMISVKTFYDETTGEFVSDQNLVRMIVTNLLSNAIKYTKEQGSVHIGYRFDESTLVFSVADNGMGIPPEEQDHLFEKLFRASNALRSVPDGTGLGLYIVKEAVSVLNGKITFTSIENQGTTFEVVFPLRL